ncbi:hypothetical protein RIF29_28912 [Crotalaria pallida]|uniref:Uncharacterized protein n=1 Tax=Crotalaria pallida TaxID=3830 RepID=A0AAN9EDT8_CROPI
MAFLITALLLIKEHHNFPKSGSFKFLNMFTQASDFLNMVKDVWQADIPGYAMYRVGAKLKMLKEPLKMFNNRDFLYIDLKEKHMRVALDDVQTRLRSNPQDVSIEKEEKELYATYLKTLYAVAFLSLSAGKRST